MSDEETLDRADHILSSIAHELDLATSASDPHPVEDEYIDWMLEYTQGLVYRNEDGFWEYSAPTLKEAREIIAAHEEDS